MPRFSFLDAVDSMVSRLNDDMTKLFNERVDGLTLFEASDICKQMVKLGKTSGNLRETAARIYNKD